MSLVNVLKRLDELFTGKPYEEKNEDLIENEDSNSYTTKHYYFKNHKQGYFKRLKLTVDNLLIQKKELENKIKLIDESISDKNRQALINEVIRLEKERENLSKTNKRLTENINKLSFQKEMLQTEIDDLEEKKKGIFVSDNNNLPLSIEYIDNLADGLMFEKCFASILKRLHYTNIEITPSSGDYGIDVLARKDDILYGFQCKLYSNPVGNEAIQEAYSGKQHYNCNIAVVVTNNTFTEQAKLQALETQVILWDRKVIEKKLREINS